MITPADYIEESLQQLKKSEPPKPFTSLDDEICRLLLFKKFRKYSATPALQDHIRNAVKLNIEKQEPIKIVFVHGCYKLWRLDEAPQADWAELFAAMYYTQWLKSICDIYKPGVWFDFYVDDLIVPELNNVSLEDIQTYRKSFRDVLDFLKPYQPTNMKMTITSVGDQFASPEDFHKKLQSDAKDFAKQFPNGLPEITEHRARSLELNVKPSDIQNDPLWKEKNALLHDAYIMRTKFEAGYHRSPDKILTFTQPLPNGMFLALGTTKTSIAKFWVGVGALEKKGDSYMPYILTPHQIETRHWEKEPITISRLSGQNFHSIRVIS